MNFDDVMDEIAERVKAAPTLAGRTYAWPIGKVTPPAAIVAYPPGYEYDKTYGRGLDTMGGSLVLILGAVSDRQTRSQLARYTRTDSEECIKNLVDGDGDYESCDSVTVLRWEPDTWTIGAIDHLAVVFALEIAGPGTA